MARRKLGVHRNPERVIDLTDEAIAANVLPTTAMDIWYDKNDVRLSVYRVPISNNLVFRCVVSRGEARALVASGLKTHETPYVSMEGVKTVAAARDWMEQFKPKLAEAMATYTPPSGKTRPLELPEDILKDRPPEEQAKYETLMGVLMDAYAQAVNGKGAARHAGGEVSFDKQDMMLVMDRVGMGAALGQAIKKITEGNRLPKALARAEFLGAIVYLAGAIAWQDQSEDK